MMPVDAEMYWLSSKVRSDQFLLFAFDAAGRAVDDAELLARARAIPVLNQVVRETIWNLDYPRWVPARAASSQIVTRASGQTFVQVLDDVAHRLVDAQVVPTREAWRLHLYPDVTEAPDAGGPCNVAVLQVSHALADGRGATSLARQLFAPPQNRPGAPTDRRIADQFPLTGGFGGRVSRFASRVGRIAGRVGRFRGRVGLDAAVLDAAGGLVRLPMQVGGIAVRGRRAYRLSRAEPTARLPAPAGPANTDPGEYRQLRVLIVDAADLRIAKHSVTVGAIMVISDAMRDAGLAPLDGDVRIELTIARSSTIAHNNFFNASIDAHTRVSDDAARAAAIAAEIDDARRGDAAAPRAAARYAEQATPALLMRWGTTAFDADATSETVAGHTVVSSVNRGAADLALAGGIVRFTAGFPALSRMQGLTHGVHGIGSRVALSVATSPQVTDVDAHLDALSRTVGNYSR